MHTSALRMPEAEYTALSLMSWHAPLQSYPDDFCKVSSPETTYEISPIPLQNKKMPPARMVLSVKSAGSLPLLRFQDIKTLLPAITFSMDSFSYSLPFPFPPKVSIVYFKIVLTNIEMLS